MNLNLGALKYRNILYVDGGPLQYIKTTKKQIRINESGFEAYTMLQANYLNGFISSNIIYGNSTGTGSDSLLSVAVYKSISESIERWAFFESVNQKSVKAKIGYNIEASTSGMAAYPGLFPESARRQADYEAIERWTIRHWWHEYLPCRQINYKSMDNLCAIEIMTPWRKVHVVVLCYRNNNQSNIFYSYGFAAEKTIIDACKKAEVELFRNNSLLDSFLNIQTNEQLNIQEKRIRFFSSTEGFQSFKNKVAKTALITTLPFMPESVVDVELKGPWRKFAYVWRVLYKPLVEHYSEDCNEFYF